MATNGMVMAEAAPHYEDYASMKKWLRTQDNLYKTNTMKLRHFLFNQAGTGSLVEISEKGGETIAFASVDADLSIWAENNHADGLSLAWVITYTNAAGTVFSKSGTLHAADSTTAVEITGDTDFYRLRTLTVYTTTNTGYVAIGTSNKATIYGIVEEAYMDSIHSRYNVPVDRSAWLGRLTVNTSVATKIVTQLKITFTPYGHAAEHNIVLSIGEILERDPVFRVAALSEVKFEIIGNLTDNTFDFQIIELENR